MTINITTDTLAAARTGDPEAVDQILDAMEPIIAGVARSYADRTGRGFDELAQGARIDIWKLISGWDGSVDDFVTDAVRLVTTEAALRSAEAEAARPVAGYTG